MLSSYLSQQQEALISSIIQSKSNDIIRLNEEMRTETLQRDLYTKVRSIVPSASNNPNQTEIDPKSLEIIQNCVNSNCPISKIKELKTLLIGQVNQLKDKEKKASIQKSLNF